VSAQADSKIWYRLPIAISISSQGSESVGRQVQERLAVGMLIGPGMMATQTKITGAALNEWC